MKRMRKLLGMMSIAILALIASATTVSATAIGDSYSVYGVGLGWVLIAIVVVIALVAWGMQVTKKAAKPLVPVLAIMLIAGLALQFVNVAPEVADITPDVTWDVTAVSGSAGMTIDNDARTITKVIGAHAALDVINATGDVAWVAASDDPVINFTITPSMAIGVSTTTDQATTNCIVNNPDQKFTEDATSYYLFEDVSSGGDKNLIWVTDGTTDYEAKLCTVTIGGSEVAKLTIHLLDDGLSEREVGESHTFTIGIGGITYTMTVMITEVNTMDS